MSEAVTLKPLSDVAPAAPRKVLSGQILRVPKKIPQAARHNSRLNAIGIWLSPDDTRAWLEVRPGSILIVVGRAKKMNGVWWREVRSPDDVVEGYAKEQALFCTELVAAPSDRSVRVKKPKLAPSYPGVGQHAYVGVRAAHTPKNIGLCISISYDRLPDKIFLGLATFKMTDGRERKAWLTDTQKTEHREDTINDNS